MNTPTLIGTYIFGVLVVALIGVVIRRMLRGWKHRADRQAEAIGVLPALPELFGSTVVVPSTGLYVGSTIAPSWLERVVVGDLGYRCKATLTRYAGGILMERSGASPIWIPQESITGLRTELGLAGKVLPSRGSAQEDGGILVIRWRLPSGTEIDTGFRGDDRRDYAHWISAAKAARLIGESQ